MIDTVREQGLWLFHGLGFRTVRDMGTFHFQYDLGIHLRLPRLWSANQTWLRSVLQHYGQNAADDSHSKPGLLGLLTYLLASRTLTSNNINQTCFMNSVCCRFLEKIQQNSRRPLFGPVIRCLHLPKVSKRRNCKHRTDCHAYLVITKKHKLYTHSNQRNKCVLFYATFSN